MSLQSIKEDYPELFMRSVLQVSIVDGMGDWVDKEWKWNLHLEKRSLESGAVCLKEELFEKLDMFYPICSLQDNFEWT